MIAHPDDELGDAELAALGAGPVIYLLGSVAFKVRVLGALWEPRAIAAALIAGVTVVGTLLPALAVWSLVFAVLGGVAVVEVVRSPARPTEVRGG